MEDLGFLSLFLLFFLLVCTFLDHDIRFLPPINSVCLQMTKKIDWLLCLSLNSQSSPIVPIPISKLQKKTQQLKIPASFLWVSLGNNNPVNCPPFEGLIDEKLHQLSHSERIYHRLKIACDIEMKFENQFLDSFTLYGETLSS